MHNVNMCICKLCMYQVILCMCICNVYMCQVNIYMHVCIMLMYVFVHANVC